MLRIYRSLAVTVLLLGVGPWTAHGQQTGVKIEASPENMKDMARQLYPSAFEHAHTGQSLVAVLKADGHYSTFLALVERAGLLPLLQGKVRDTTYTAVSFVEVEDSTQNPLVSAGNIQIQGLQGLPPNMNQTGVNEAVTEQLEKLTTEAEHYALAQDSLLTVFAPTNAAFAKVPKKQMDSLSKDSVALITFVRAHFVNKGVFAAAFPKIQSMQSLAGSSIPVDRSTGRVGGVALVTPEAIAVNGVVHGLTSVFPWPTAPATP